MPETIGDSDERTPAAPAGDESGDVHVLYIAGIGRSGSTLLCRTLGSVEGFLGTGELMRIVPRGVGTGDLCSCETAVSRCALWSAVLTELDRRCPDVDFERFERIRMHVVEGWGLLPYLLLTRRPATFERNLEDFRRFLAALYGAIRTVTGARVIVDASKHPVFARLLAETPGVRVSIVHLVRDSRGVAHSLTRRRRRPGTHGREECFPRHGVALGSFLWSAAHMMTEAFRPRMAHFVRVRYEDFVASPSATVERIVREVDRGAGDEAMAHVGEGSVHLGVDHLIASNPNRSRRGMVQLHEDVAWQRKMSAPRRWIVTGLTFGLLRRYGYPTLPGG